MDMRSKLDNDLKDALRAADEVRKTTIRSILAAIKLAQTEKRGTLLDDPAIIGLVQKEVKSRKESIADAEKANRPDLIVGYKAEIIILEEYLPKQLSAEEINAMVARAIEQTGASLPTDMGKVMKIVLPLVQGRAPNDQISSAVRALLEQKQ